MTLGAAIAVAAVVATLVLVREERQPLAPTIEAADTRKPGAPRARDAARRVAPARVVAPRTGDGSVEMPARKVGFREHDPMAGQPEDAPDRVEIRRPRGTRSPSSPETPSSPTRSGNDSSAIYRISPRPSEALLGGLAGAHAAGVPGRAELGEELRARVAMYFTDRQRQLLESLFPESLIFMVGAGHVLEVQVGDAPPEPYKGPREPRG